MNKLSTLGAITGGAIALSIAFALAMKDRSASLNIDGKSGNTVYHEITGDKGEFVLRNSDINLRAKWRGDYEFNSAGTDIISLNDSFSITSKEDGVARKAIFEGGRDGVTRSYYIDGDKQSAGAQTSEAIAGLLLTFLRASGQHADERVEAIFAQGGAEAVFAEMDRLHGDHALSRYVMALTETADLSDDEILTLAAKLETIKSDHDLSVSLQSVLKHEAVSSSVMAVLIAAADGVESDHDKRKLVEAFARRPLTAHAMTLTLALFERIGNDHDLRIAAQALLKSNAMDIAGAARIVDFAARQIESDHDLRLILIQSAGSFTANDAFMAAWLKSFRTLGSGHDQRLAIIAVAQTSALSEPAWISLIEATGAIDASHDQRLALEIIAATMDRTDALVAAYRQSAGGIAADHDRKQALEALGGDAAP